MNMNSVRTLLTAALLISCACTQTDGAADAAEAVPLDRCGTSDGGASECTTSLDQIALTEERLVATNNRDWDRWESLHTPNAIRTAPELDQPLVGAPALRAAIEALSFAFPDYHLELEQAFGQGEWLAVRLHTTGTMTGPLTLSDGSQIPPTARPIEQHWAALVRIDRGKIAEFHEFYDQLLLMRQLGLLAP